MITKLWEGREINIKHTLCFDYHYDYGAIMYCALSPLKHSMLIIVCTMLRYKLVLTAMESPRP